MHHTDPYTQEAKRQKVALAIGGTVLLVVLLIGFGLSALGVNRNQPQPTLAQQTHTPEPALPAVVNPPDPALPIQKPEGMPQDIYNWLEHLRVTDERLSADTNSIGMSAGLGRMRGLADLYGSALEGNFEDHNPTRESDQINQKTDQTFQELRAYFESYPPPAECVPIANAYRVSLSETEANINEISRLTEKAFSNFGQSSTDDIVNDLRAIYSDHRDGIDEHRRQTDRLVQQVCDKYRTRKWFSIKADPANPIMKGMVDMMLNSLGN